MTLNAAHGTSATARSSSVALVLLFQALLFLGADAASAHEVSLGQSKIRQEGEIVSFELAVGYDELALRVGAAKPAISSPEELTDADLETAMRARQNTVAAYVGSRVRIYLDGVACKGSLRRVDVIRHQGKEYAVMSLAYNCPGSPSGSYEIHYDLFFDEASLSHGLAHANIADYSLAGAQGRFVFEPGNQRLVAGGTNPLSSAGPLVVLGFEHILGGIDHVLFLLALLLGARSVMSVVKVVAAFTMAHSITLVFASLGWVNVPASLVEPLIALSIAYVAIENLIFGESRRRLFVVFGFGLMHGLGFAGNLTFTDRLSWHLISSLFAFNIGIELGQVVIVLLASPLVLVSHRLHPSREKRAGAATGPAPAPVGAERRGGRALALWRFALMGTSGVIASFGSLWLLERLS